MATIAKPAALILRDCLVTIGADDYQNQLSSVAFTPTTSQVTWQGLAPDAKLTESTPSTWTVAIEGAQDWDATASLCNYLLANEGTLVQMVFRPRRVGSGKAIFTAQNVSIVPPTIGGGAGTQPTFSVTMGCDKPVKTVSV